MGIEGMVGDVLTKLLTVYVKIQRLRQGFPFVHALESHKMFTLEAFYHLETVADIVIRQFGRLTVGQRPGCIEADIIPIYVCLESIVDKRRLLVKLIDELAAQGVAVFRAAPVFSNYAVTIVKKVRGDVRGIGCDAIE